MRHCPFHQCGKPIMDSLFACNRHWFSLSKDEQAEIHGAYNDYLNDRIGLEELRQIQQSVLGARGDARK